ncbi:uncharacterized protein LOC128232848 isoform X4 [Mya arenaria]|uniref:uncharacterized protein LOC128232848 isoform X4 n=1 Tax=Mya arenaria TaxID=6604 RepID=UPI0022E06A12|nr:uncharacterized protein LOC128232848 isoform X4 [Mya arenaria]
MNINVQRKMDSPLHKWLVLLSAVMVMSVDISLTHNTGQIFVAVMDRFNSNRAQTAVIQSTLIAVLFATGIGTSALLLTAMTAAGQHWEGNSHRPIVLSLISAGSGLGGTIYLYLITTLKSVPCLLEYLPTHLLSFSSGGDLTGYCKELIPSTQLRTTHITTM